MMTEDSVELPLHKTYDHAIDFKDNTITPRGLIYPLNETELEELRKWLKKMTTMGAVRESKSAYSSPCCLSLKVMVGAYASALTIEQSTKSWYPIDTPSPTWMS